MGSRNDLLSLRDRSLVTITSLISMGITDNSLKYHLSTAKQNGISRTEIAEIITHIAFYAGWLRHGLRSTSQKRCVTTTSKGRCKSRVCTLHDIPYR